MVPVLHLGALSCVVLLLATGCTDTTRPPEELLPSLPSARATDTGPVRPDPNYEHPRPAHGDALARFPTVTELGYGWGYARATSRGDGYGKGGAPAAGRVPAFAADIGEVVDKSAPEDCLRLNPLPIPSTAIEARYTFGSTPVTVSEVGFGSSAVAGAFFSLLVANLEDCTEESGSGGRVLVGQVIEIGDGVALADRYPDDTTERRTDLLVLTDMTVLLLRAPVELGAAPFTSAGSVKLAQAFRVAARR
jgi:hypothetical protein